MASQAAVIAVLLLIALLLVRNVAGNLERQHIASGFGFLNDSAGFTISQSAIPYEPTDSYGRAFVVGLVNTLIISAAGIVLATLVGLVVGVASLSRNPVVAFAARLYVELARNLPMLFQMLFWYVAILKPLPDVRAAFHLGPGIYLSNRGLIVPRLTDGPGLIPVLAAIVLGLGLMLTIRAQARGRFNRMGTSPDRWNLAGYLVLILPLALVMIVYRPGIEFPEATRFNFHGGFQIFPEFIALLLALTFYFGAFISEIVRAGILAVARGQAEAAKALGLNQRQAMRMVVLPQAMRMIVPPLTNQHLNILKASSLATAVGYPDLVAIFVGTTLGQTGQAIEVVALTMATYLCISVMIALAMNLYNRRVALVSR